MTVSRNGGGALKLVGGKTICGRVTGESQ